MQAGFDGGEAQAQNRGGFLSGQAFDIAQRDDEAVLDREERRSFPRIFFVFREDVVFTSGSGEECLGRRPPGV